MTGQELVTGRAVATARGGGAPSGRVGVGVAGEAAGRDAAGTRGGVEGSGGGARVVYVKRLADARAGGPSPPEGRAGLERLVSDLQTQIGS